MQHIDEIPIKAKENHIQNMMSLLRVGSAQYSEVKTCILAIFINILSHRTLKAELCKLRRNINITIGVVRKII